MIPFHSWIYLKDGFWEQKMGPAPSVLVTHMTKTPVVSDWRLWGEGDYLTEWIFPTEYPNSPK
jgi:hypothetical protein